MNINELTDSLVIEVPGCPLPTIRDMIRWAQRELCSEGNVWLVSDGPVIIGANTPFAEVDQPSGAETLRIVKITDNGRLLRPGNDYIHKGGNEVEFMGRKPSSVTLLGEIACRPVYGADMPQELLSRWAEALLDGARSRLLIMPQSWQNPELSEHYRRKFIDAQSYARSLSATGYQVGSVRMKTRPFA